MRAESRDRRGGYVLECRRFRAANRNQRYCCGWCENVAGPRGQRHARGAGTGEAHLMWDGYKFEFGAFDEPDASKAQALKPLEEAAEVYGAWQDCDDMRLSPIMTARREYRQNLIDECMDVVQAVVSLLDAEGFTQEDVDAAIERCNERNRERGRL